MTPKEISGTWWVSWIDQRGELNSAGPFTTNGEAWRWIDRHEGQPLSKAEDRGDWAFGEIAGGKGL
ncbi:hypothetical protein [Rhizobium terrae]|uniref:hypothetical protein n=1 Tax=Rhizobium terrae TaxID=2171756 RepID=UPI000E3E2150|nr:hypothetical protein [Rhizobium terrae]